MQLKKKLKGSLRVTFAAMTVALTVMLLYITSVLPTGRIALYFIASLMLVILLEEQEWSLAIAAFIASSVITFLFIADKIFVAPYAALLGHYGIFRQFLLTRVHDRWLQWFVKLLYLNSFTALCIVTVTVWLELLNLAIFLDIMPFWAWAALLQPVFIGYDLLFSLMVRFYNTMLRPILIGRKN